ncbi:hypothetical protein ABZY81_40900 [Streptomyces sp. NPDC006514]
MDVPVGHLLHTGPTRQTALPRDVLLKGFKARPERLAARAWPGRP